VEQIQTALKTRGTTSASTGSSARSLIARCATIRARTASRSTASSATTRGRSSRAPRARGEHEHDHDDDGLRSVAALTAHEIERVGRSRGPLRAPMYSSVRHVGVRRLPTPSIASERASS
jgi:hypothetical protein